jgi:nucleotide-binding universal stress UspA family protein
VLLSRRRTCSRAIFLTAGGNGRSPALRQRAGGHVEIVQQVRAPGAAGVDLVVMGTHGRRGPSLWWLGSVAKRVLLDIGE